MKKWSVLLLMVAVSMFALGCGAGGPEPVDNAEMDAADQQMEADMEKMTGQVPQTPEKGATGGGAAEPATEE